MLSPSYTKFSKFYSKLNVLIARIVSINQNLNVKEIKNNALNNCFVNILLRNLS